MNNTQQGYQLFATGDNKYLQLAINCAASLKYWDKKRPIQLVTDNTSTVTRKSLKKLFDTITLVSKDAFFCGPLIKLKMYEHAIYPETLFVDADCLLLKSDIDRYWELLSNNYDVTTPGNYLSTGEWYEMRIEKICEIAQTDRILKMNSGVFYFKKNENSRKFFASAISAVTELGNFTGYIHREVGLPDEPYFGIAFARENLVPFPVMDENGNGLMISTIKSSNHRFDPLLGTCEFVKQERAVSPSLCHFVGLRPSLEYQELSKQYRRLLEVPQISAMEECLGWITPRLAPKRLKNWLSGNGVRLAAWRK